jgi:hypothetical protein
MKITLTRAQRRLIKACLTDKSRPTLQCLAVGNGWVAAADGFMLARMRHPFKGNAVLFPADFIKRFAKCGDVDFTVGPHYISASDGDYTITIDRSRWMMMYPNHRLVVRALLAKKTKAKVALNCNLLMRAAELAKPGIGDIMRFYVRGTSDAVLITAKSTDGSLDEQDMEMVLMSMCVNWGE